MCLIGCGAVQQRRWSVVGVLLLFSSCSFFSSTRYIQYMKVNRQFDPPQFANVNSLAPHRLAPFKEPALAFNFQHTVLTYLSFQVHAPGDTLRDLLCLRVHICC